MPWLETAFPVRMARIALVAPAGLLRDMLVGVAAAGIVEIDRAAADADSPGEAARIPHTAGSASIETRRLAAAQSRTSQPGSAGPGSAGPGSAGSGSAGPEPGQYEPALSASRPDLDVLERAGRQDLLAGEAQLQAYAAGAVRGHAAEALAGWTPADQLDELAAALAGLGCAAVPLPRPRSAEAPTLVAGTPARRVLSPLVSTYGTVPYADINPAWLAWGSYVVMFGMMFGDIGDGLLLIAAAVALRAGWLPRARRFRASWPFVGGAGLAATAFGALYGEFFGPTGLIPTIWLDPLSHPIPLLLAGIGFGAVLLAGAYALGTVNRWREGGWPLALYAPSGIAGAALFLGIGLVAAGWYYHHGALLIAGALLAAAALALAFAGFLVDAGGGGFGIAQGAVEVFDLVIRLGSNVASFARLAAFGLAHAALGLLVWEGTRALWDRGGVMIAAAIVVFFVGSALAFGLEALVAAVQALRLEYYELFSRVFVGQGRPFRPWRLPVETSHEGTVIAGALAPGQGVG